MKILIRGVAITLLVAIPISLYNFFLQDTSSVLQVTPMQIDLTKSAIVPNRPLLQNFQLENKSNSPITIQRIQAPCACAGITVKEKFPQSIRAGEMLQVSAEFVAQPKFESQEFQVGVYYTSSKGGSEQVEFIQLMLWAPPPLTAHPSTISLGQIGANSVIVREVTISRSSAYDLAPSQLSFSSNSFVDVELSGYEDQNVAGLNEHEHPLCRLKVTIDASNHMGSRISGAIVIKAADLSDSLAIPVFGFKDAPE